jgi:hypothetical protein
METIEVRFHLESKHVTFIFNQLKTKKYFCSYSFFYLEAGMIYPNQL